MSAVAQSLRRELRHLRHDRGDGFLTLLMLPLLCLLIGWIFSNGQPERLPVAWIDADQSASSRTLLRLVDATPGVALQGPFADSASALTAMRQRQVYAVLVIPNDFEQAILSAKPAHVLLQLNSQYATYASTIERHVTAAVLTAGAGIAIERLKRQGLYSQASAEIAIPISVMAAPLFNDGPNYEVFLAATLIPALFQIMAMVLTVSAVGRELRDGSAAEWLNNAEGSLLAALTGKLLPSFVLLNLYAAVVVMAFTHWLSSSYAGNPLTSWLTFVLLNSSAMAVGLLVIAVSRNMRMGLSIAGFYSAPAYAFAGQAFPLVAMPAIAQGWASLLPLTHWLKLYNQLWMAGAPLSQVASSLLVLLAMIVTASIGGYLLLQRYAFNPANWGAR